MQQRKNRANNVVKKKTPPPPLMVKPSGLQFTLGGQGQYSVVLANRRGGGRTLVHPVIVGMTTRRQPIKKPFPPGTKVSKAVSNGLAAWFRRLEKQYAD